MPSSLATPLPSTWTASPSCSWCPTGPGAARSRCSCARLKVGADIVINRHVVESDVAIVVGPVFPH
ncbi:MAG: hypothetical protein WCG47_11920 [Dermatophilaceae bacterium]